MMRWVRRVWPPGVRLQLTLVYGAGCSLIMLLAMLLGSLVLNLTALSNFDTQLNRRVDTIARQIDPAGNSLKINDSGSGVLLVSSDPASKMTVYVPGDSQTFVQVLDFQGNLLYYSQNYGEMSISPYVIASAQRLAKPTSQEQATNHANVTLRILTVALIPDATSTKTPKTAPLKVVAPQVIGILQVGYPLSQREFFSTHVTSYLPFVALVLVGLSFVAGRLLATRVFRPIHRLTKAARDIAKGNLSRRVPVPLTRDDVHDLASSFNDMAVQLEVAFAQQRRFVADASHELRTPVAAIRSLTEVALVHPDPEATVQALRAVHGESERLGRLINDLLILARADEGRLQLDRDPVRLDLLAADAVASMVPLAEEQALQLTAQTLVPVTILGDAARLIQVMLSLLDNALTYTPAGGSVTVNVTTWQNQALFSVQDTGVGIDAADLPHIFERFYRADPARSRAAGGTGLGLALALDLVRAHGGTISIATAPGQGSTFTVVLPVQT